MMCQSNTTKLYYVYYCIRGNMFRCFYSYRIIFRPFQDTDPYLAMFKTPQHLSSLDIVFLQRLMVLPWLAINLMFAILKCLTHI